MSMADVKAKSTRYKHQKYVNHKGAKRLLIIACSSALFILVFNALINVSSAQDAPKGEAPKGGQAQGEVPNGIVPKADEDKKANIVAKNIGDVAAGVPGLNLTDGTSIWHAGRKGHGTMHEQMGIPHFQPVKYTAYNSRANYTKPTSYSSYGMDPIFFISDFIFSHILTDDPAIPEGYIEITDDNNIKLGKKAIENDWVPLLSQYWIVLLFVLIMVLLIILMPCFAVCYCCFCCHKRCGRQCPPCDEKPDAAWRCFYGFILLVLIVFIVFGVYIAFVNNTLMETGFSESTRTLRRGSSDTCTFLENTGNHLKHLYMNNYQELETQVSNELNNAHRHIFLDLSDVSKANALNELVRIFENMPKAIKLMTEVDKLEKEARFFAAQLRDALRGVKRDLNFIRGSQCRDPYCQNFLSVNNIENLDLGCTHYDTVPNTTQYVETMKDIVADNYLEIPQQGIARLDRVSNTVKDEMTKIVPPLIEDVREGYDVMREQADSMRSLVDAVVSDIHLHTTRSTKSFDDLNEQIGNYRNIINYAVCVTLLVILMCLIIALCCGCCGSRPRGYRDDCCNKGSGANCLLFAMFLIFTTFSIIMMIGLFYFIFGILTYQGACAPLRDQNKNAIFNSIDKSFDLTRLLSRSKLDEDNDNPLPPVRLSHTLEACQANQSIYEVLHMNRLYSSRNLRLMKVLRDLDDDIDEKAKFDTDLSQILIIPQQEINALNEMRNGNLSDYHSSKYKTTICKEFVPTSLTSLAAACRDLAYTLRFDSYPNAYITLLNQELHLKTYQNNLLNPLKEKVDKIYKLVDEIDSLILFKNLDFKDSIGVLIEAIQESEQFVRKRGGAFVTEIATNLSMYVVTEVEAYRDMLIRDSEQNVGRCGPLARVYDNGVDLVCNRLAHPVNGFWMGVLLCCFLFLPTLWIAHKLQCLYKKVDPYASAAVAATAEGGEYLYDAYSERDHYPMASGPKKRRKGHDRRREYEYYDDASPGMSSHTAASGMRDSRYKDMAPQHWDSEPPRYHNPPMAPPASEYERPPPYYYPGAAEQD